MAGDGKLGLLNANFGPIQEILFRPEKYHSHVLFLAKIGQNKDFDKKKGVGGFLQ